MWAGPGPLRECTALVDDNKLDWETLQRLVNDERAHYVGDSEGRGDEVSDAAAVDVGEGDECDRRCKKQRNDDEAVAASASDDAG